MQRYAYPAITWLCLSAALLCGSSLAAKSLELQHVEPQFWWAGMAHPELQVMVHANNISASEVSVDYPGVSILSLQTTDNPNFLFVNLGLDEQVKPGTFELQFSQAGQPVASYPYQLKARRDKSAARQGFAAKDVIYLIAPDRFANGDLSNDSLPIVKEAVNRQAKGGRHGGDIQGIIDHLDYIADMGFTQIWTMPLMENDMPAYSYHGYSTTDYYQIDPRFGDNALYQRLSHQAGERGIGVIQDVILNHIGSQHWWMDDKPSQDWINNQGEFTPTSHMREALHDPHAAKIDKVSFNDGWFVPTMPDLNQRNPLLATYLIQNSIWWIEFANLSGLRVDTYSYSDMAFLSQWTKRVMTEYPNFNIVGEEWTVNPAIVAFWQNGSQRHSDYQSSLPSVMDFPAQAKLVDSLTQSETWASGLRELYEIIATDFVYGDPYNLVVFADNHDMSRIYSQLNQDMTLFKMALTWVMTTRGIPQLFYGTELAMANPGSDDHGIIRSDFPGGWPADPVNGFNGSGLNAEQQAAQQFVKTLLNWRKGSAAITTGKLTHYAPKDGVYVYFRHTDNQRVMVILNKNQNATQLDLGRYSEGLADATQATEIISQTAVPLGKSLTLPGKGAFVYQLLN